MAFSPHTRGCSLGDKSLFMHVNVFPAYAGMFLCHLARNTGSVRFPRIRGDVPQSILLRADPDLFSPHTRGCS